MEDLAQVVLVGNSMVGSWCIRDVDSKRLVQNGGTWTLFLLVAWLLALDDCSRSFWTCAPFRLTELAPKPKGALPQPNTNP